MQDNNLVMALLGAGVVFVLVIVVYNQWQIRKARGPQAYQPPADEGVRTDAWKDRQEPIGVGVASAMRAEDVLFPSYRDH
ncbi:cell division protein ZipA C-terminal FtsZ-binding domain-containing protein, partial [Ralstonia pseudosolanacearum]